MLAFLGLLVQEFVHLPDPMFSNPVGTEALKQVPLGGWPQIFLFCGIVELVTMKGDYSYVQYADNADKHTPGDFGFNPLGLKADRKMREAEVKYVVFQRFNLAAKMKWEKNMSLRGILTGQLYIVLSLFHDHRNGRLAMLGVGGMLKVTLILLLLNQYRFSSNLW